MTTKTTETEVKAIEHKMLVLLRSMKTEDIKTVAEILTHEDSRDACVAMAFVLDELESRMEEGEFLAFCKTLGEEA